MNETNQVAVDLIAEPKGLKAGYDQALGEQQKFHQSFVAREEAQLTRQQAIEARWRASKLAAEQETQRELERSRNRATEVETRFIETLKRQADTLGMSKSEMLRYTAQQDVLTERGREVVKTLTAKIDAHEREAAALARVEALTARIARFAGLAVTVGGAFAVRQAAEAERSEARFDAIWRATGGTAGFSRAELGDFVDEMTRRTVHSDEAIRDAMARLMTFRQVSGEAFKDTMLAASGLAEVMGGNLAGAVETLGRALENPVAGLDSLRRAGIVLSPVQKELIKDLAEHGRTAEAAAVLLQVLKDKGFHAVSEEVKQGYTKSISEAKKQTGEFFEALGKHPGVKIPVTTVLDDIAARMERLKRYVEADWFTRLQMWNQQPWSKGEMGPPAPDAGEMAERTKARAAAGAAAWQRDFESYQANLKKMGEDADKAMLAAERFHDEVMRHAHEQAAAELKLHAERLKRFEAMDKGGADFARALAMPYVEAAQAATEAAEQVAYSWDEAGNRIQVPLKEFGKEAKDTFHAVRDTGSEAFRELQSAVEGWGRETSRTLAKMTMDGNFTFDSLGAAARRFLEELIAIQYQKRLMAPWIEGGTRFLDDLLFGGGMNPGGPTNWTSTGGTFHGGGIVGHRSHDRLIPAAVVANAPRFHNGYPGLRPNERVGVFEPDEEILPRSDPRHRWNLGRGAPGVTVNVINNTGQQFEAQASAPRIDGDQMVVDLLIRGLSTNMGAREQVGALLDPRYRR